jgi:hypothetical protein
MRTTPREVQDFKSIKESFCLSEKQEAVLLGTILGDGALKRRGIYHRLHIKHSRNQLSLVEYKRKIFSNITNMSIRNFVQEVNNKNYEFSEFVTLTHSEFTRFYEGFYKTGRKGINKKILKLFRDPLSLAIWFMDDGCAEHAGVSFHTQSFFVKEVDLLRRHINDVFSIETTRRRNKNGWIIYIPKRQLDIFQKLVYRHILPEFRYKLCPYSTRS